LKTKKTLSPAPSSLLPASFHNHQPILQKKTHPTCTLNHPSSIIEIQQQAANPYKKKLTLPAPSSLNPASFTTQNKQDILQKKNPPCTPIPQSSNIHHPKQTRYPTKKKTLPAPPSINPATFTT
jgi:hypothetical protein